MSGELFIIPFSGILKLSLGTTNGLVKHIKDRLFKGYDQRWAYVTVSSFISPKIC